jgi:hypothetical protein
MDEIAFILDPLASQGQRVNKIDSKMEYLWFGNADQIDSTKLFGFSYLFHHGGKDAYGEI